MSQGANIKITFNDIVETHGYVYVRDDLLGNGQPCPVVKAYHEDRSLIHVMSTNELQPNGRLIYNNEAVQLQYMYAKNAPRSYQHYCIYVPAPVPALVTTRRSTVHSVNSAYRHPGRGPAQTTISPQPNPNPLIPPYRHTLTLGRATLSFGRLSRTAQPSQSPAAPSSMQSGGRSLSTPPVARSRSRPPVELPGDDRYLAHEVHGHSAAHLYATELSSGQPGGRASLEEQYRPRAILTDPMDPQASTVRQRTRGRPTALVKLTNIFGLGDKRKRR